MNVSWNEGEFFSLSMTISHVYFPGKFPNKLWRDPMASETYISLILFIKGNNLGHMYSMN